MRAASFVLLALLTPGCTYSTARLDYARHPELRSVRLWADRSDAKVPNLGTVESHESGWVGCDRMATRATLRLLDDARARGGSGVAATRYYQMAHWAGRPRCRRNWVLLGHMSVRAVGLAVQTDPGAPTAGVSR
jgi:hypothetical protein